jgi:membrane carboxypeptidase/penicillin-binding protein
MVASVERAAFYQLKTMLQGVLARGTARTIAGLSPYVAGKTGTSDDENDAWFVGFTNDVTVAVWIGYDNADGKRRTLGGGSTGGGVAVPIFEPVMQAMWANVAPKAALAPPSPDAKRQLACKSIELESGEIQTGRGKAFSECFRIDAKGKVLDTEYVLVSGKAAHANQHGKAAHAKQNREVSRPKTHARANNSHDAVRNSYSWNDPWRATSQWNWQAQYEQRGREEGDNRPPSGEVGVRMRWLGGADAWPVAANGNRQPAL